MGRLTTMEPISQQPTTNDMVQILKDESKQLKVLKNHYETSLLSINARLRILEAQITILK